MGYVRHCSQLSIFFLSSFKTWFVIHSIHVSLLFSLNLVIILLISSIGVLIGHPPLSLFSVNPTSVPGVNKEPPFKETSESPKPCCGCLGRDTIANAAARVGPAVVNLSVPKGLFQQYI